MYILKSTTSSTTRSTLARRDRTGMITQQPLAVKRAPVTASGEMESGPSEVKQRHALQELLDDQV
jgi:hypothetical protein